MNKLNKKVSVSIPGHLIACVEREAARKNWDVDLVIEEAVLAYLESEKPMGKNTPRLHKPGVYSSHMKPIKKTNKEMANAKKSGLMPKGPAKETKGTKPKTGKGVVLPRKGKK